MPRTAGSPFKYVKVAYAAKPTTVVLLNCIPHTKGYYEGRFKVLQACIASILKHTDEPFDFMIVDNGSRPDVVDYLRDLAREGLVQHLFLHSRNLGVGAALNMAFRAAPGKYIAFTNDDVFFYPNWLSQQLQVLETFPRTGFVGGQVTSGEHKRNPALQVAKEFGIVHQRYTIPRDQLIWFARSVGYDLDKYLNSSAVRDDETYLFEHQGVKALTACPGYAFVFRRELVDRLPPISSALCIGGEDRLWHEAANRAGYVHLSTLIRTTHHLGNELDEEDRAFLQQYAIEVGDDVISTSREPSLGRRFLRRGRVRRVIRWMYEKLGELAS